MLVVSSASTTSACTVPVFRYALDRWESDPFRLVVPEAWMTDREKLKLLVPLRGNGVANILVEERSDPGLTSARLLFPRHDTVLSEAELNSDSLASMLDSSARRELVSRLLAGDSVVWVVATSASDKSEVDRVAARLRFLEQVATLPEQDPNDPDSKLGPGPPLLLKFSVLPISLDDPAERLFAAMLAGPEHQDFIAEATSFAAPVFGRGRVLGAWALDELDDAGIEDASLFLTGRCSCRVKNESPGWDLLVKTDWETALGRVGSEEAPDTEIVVEPVVETVVTAPEAADAVVTAPAHGPRGVSWIALGGIVIALVFGVAGWRLWSRP